jgi:hypothetical protein
MYKKQRLPWQILHNISQWNEVQILQEHEYPWDLLENVKNFCQKLPDQHGWLDIVMGKNNNFYFTENNVLTWYLDTEIEQPFLQIWLDSIAQNHI